MLFQLQHIDSKRKTVAGEQHAQGRSRFDRVNKSTPAGGSGVQTCLHGWHPDM